jgi:transcriptional regulator GlxA family with amidase domain
LLEQKENVAESKACIFNFGLFMSRYGQYQRNLVNVPEAQRKILMIKELLASTPENHYSLTELANLAGLSPWHFYVNLKIRRIATTWLVGTSTIA